MAEGAEEVQRLGTRHGSGDGEEVNSVIFTQRHKNTNGSLVTNLSSRTAYSLQPAGADRERVGTDLDDLIVELTNAARNLISNSKFATVPGLHNDTKTNSSHDLTELNGRGIGAFTVVQPRPHGGIERNPCDFDQDLTGPDLQIAC